MNFQTSATQQSLKKNSIRLGLHVAGLQKLQLEALGFVVSLLLAEFQLLELDFLLPLSQLVLVHFDVVCLRRTIDHSRADYQLGIRWKLGQVWGGELE